LMMGVASTPVGVSSELLYTYMMGVA